MSWKHVRNLLGCVLLCGALASPSICHADKETDAARRLYESATKHFDLTEYEAALNDFKEGFRHKDDAVFLYNIAQCYRLLNKNEEALKFYRNYLRREPNAPNREEVERRIATLQQAIAGAQSRPTQPPVIQEPRSAVYRPATNVPATGPQPAPTTMTLTTVPPTRRSATPIYKRWWFWTGAAAVIGAGVGIGLGIGLSKTTTEPVLPPIRSMQ